MNISNYQLTEADQLDFDRIFKTLDIQKKLSLTARDKSVIRIPTKRITSEEIPSPSTNWNQYKQWIFECLENLERYSILEVKLSSVDYSYLLEEISKLNNLLNKKEDKEKIIKF